jgi:hypothetical protein
MVVRCPQHSQKKAGRVLKAQSKDSWGRYLLVDLVIDGRRKHCRVHHLVMAAFVGPRPSGLQVCHLDGNPLNARLDNLRYDTPSANEADKRRHGTSPHGARCGQAKLTDEQVEQIRAIGRAVPQTAIGALFGIDQAQVSRILTGKAWVYPYCGAVGECG